MAIYKVSDDILKEAVKLLNKYYNDYSVYEAETVRLSKEEIVKARNNINAPLTIHLLGGTRTNGAFVKTKHQKAARKLADKITKQFLQE